MRIHKVLSPAILLISTSIVCAQPGIGNSPVSPAIFLEGVVSTAYSERDMAISPDGSEMFYTLQSPRQGVFQTIVHRIKGPDGKWSSASIAPFAGRYSDLEPAFTSDGKRLFFCSNRPVDGNEIKDFDIWYVDKVNGQWGDAKNLGQPVNSPIDEFYPSIARNGNLYFTAAYKSAIGKEDIFVSRLVNGQYQPPVTLDSSINSEGYEFNAYVDPDENFLIFSAYGRKDDMGGADLYMSVKGNDGNWQPAFNLVAVNSNKIDYCPFVSFDKSILFFTSERNTLQSSYPKPVTYDELVNQFSGCLNGGGNVFWISFQSLLPAKNKK